MLIFLVPIAIAEYIFSDKKRIPWFDKLPELPFSLIIHVLIAGIGWSGSLILWTFSLRYVTTVLASLCYATQPLILAVVYYCRGTMISSYEWTGVVVASIGILIASLKGLYAAYFGDEAESASAHNAIYMQVFGASLSIIAGICGILNIVYRSEQKKYIPLFLVRYCPICLTLSNIIQYTLVTSAFVTLVASILTVAVEGSCLIGMSGICVFGWMSKFWCVTMLLFGLFIGTSIAALNYSVSSVRLSSVSVIVF